MPQHTGQQFYYSGQGNVMIADRDANGDPLGFKLMGNICVLTIGAETTAFEHKECITGQRAIDLRIVTEINVTVSLEVESLTADNLALAFFGNQTAVTAGSVTDEAVTAVIPAAGETNTIVALEHIKVSNVVVTDAATGMITYADDSVAANGNYLLDADAGSIAFLDATAQGAASDAISDGDELHVSYDYDAYVLFDALTTAAPEKWLRFEGLNTARSNAPHVVDIFRFRPDPANEWQLINEELANLAITGGALLDATKPTTNSQFFRQKALV